MKTKTILNALAALLLGCGYAAAGDFGLEDFSADDVRVSQGDVRAPAAQVDAGSALIGMDLNVRVPFKLIKNAAAKMAAPGSGVTLLDPSAPVVFKSGEFIKISNVRVNSGGIIVEPTITLKPYLEARDRLAIKVQRVQIHASMQPSRAAGAAPQLSQEDIMDQVMGTMIKSVYSALDAKLKEMKSALRPQDVITLKYDKAAWILRGTVSSKILGQFIPAGLVGPVHLTGFSFNDAGIAIKVQTLN